jgi:hypothetical protein
VDYPDKGVMGLATHKGGVRLGLSATVASVVLYSAIVLFGVGSASPSAPNGASDPRASAVLIQPQADTVSGSAQRLPQASPEPGRQRLHAQAPGLRTGVAPSQGSSAPSAPSAPSAVADPTPAPPRVTESEQSSVAGSTTAAVAEPLPQVPLPVTVPSVPVPVPQLPAPLPEPPASSALPLPLPLP